MECPESCCRTTAAALPGKMSSSSVEFERHLWAHAVRTITSRHYHPQTCGKIERWHQTLKKWLRRQRLAATLEELQEHLARFAIIYNTTRPHAAHDGATPAEAYAATPKHHHDANGPSTAPTRASQRRANVNGQFKVNTVQVHLGAAYRDQMITVFVTGDHVVVYHDEAVGEVDLQATKVYARLNFASTSSTEKLSGCHENLSPMCRDITGCGHGWLWTSTNTCPTRRMSTT